MFQIKSQETSQTQMTMHQQIIMQSNHMKEKQKIQFSLKIQKKKKEVLTIIKKILIIIIIINYQQRVRIVQKKD